MTRLRSERNKRFAQGVKNRVKGVCNKAHDLTRIYGGDALVIIRPTGRDVTGYESRPGLLQEIIRIPGLELLKPQDLSLTEEEYKQPDLSTQGSSCSETLSNFSEGDLSLPKVALSPWETGNSPNHPTYTPTQCTQHTARRKRRRLTAKQGKEIIKLLRGP